jgi:O-antigen ligase
VIYNIKKISYTNFILALIIPFLIWGPFFPDLIVSLSSIFFLFYVYKNKIFNYFIQKPLIIFFIFCIYCILVSIFVAKDILLSLESSLFYFRIGVFACLIWHLIEQDKKILKYFYYALVVCFAILVVDGYIQFFSGHNIINLTIPGDFGDRISSLFGDELIMGSYLSRFFPLLFALFLLKKKNSKFEVYCIGVLFITIDILIYISGERASFFFLNLSTLFIIFLIKKYQKFRLFTFICSLVLIAGLTFTYDKFYNRMIFQTAKGMGLLKETQNKHIFTESHDSLIKTAYNMFLDKPIFGHGPKMFRVICKDESYATGISPCMTHPHNFYIQLLSETGIIGFSFLFSAFAYVLYCAYRQFKSIILKQKRYLTDYQVCLLAGILVTVWPITTNGNFFHNWLMIVYSLPMGFYLHSIYGKNRNNIFF